MVPRIKALKLIRTDACSEPKPVSQVEDLHSFSEQHSIPSPALASLLASSTTIDTLLTPAPSNPPAPSSASSHPPSAGRNGRKGEEGSGGARNNKQHSHALSTIAEELRAAKPNALLDLPSPARFSELLSLWELTQTGVSPREEKDGGSAGGVQG
ncbi:hypothetical protein T484DRAFT_1892928, partial [Baffinella frigidus]